MKAEHWSANVLGVLAVLWLGLFPLWQGGSYSHITRDKWVGFLILTGVTVVAAVEMVCVLRATGEKRRFRFGAPQGLMLLYLAWLGLSALFGDWAGNLNGEKQLTVLMGARRYEGLLTQAGYGLIFLCMSCVLARRAPAVAACAVAVLVNTVLIALQYADMNPLGLFPTGRSIRTNYEFQGTIGNIDMVSGWLCLALPPLAVGAVRGRGKGRFALLIAAWATVALLLCMEVQSGLLTLALVLAVLVLAALHRPATLPSTALLLGGALMLVTLRLLTGLPWLDGTADIVFPHAFGWRKLLPALAGVVLIALGWGLRPLWLRWRGLCGRTLALLAVLGAAGVLLLVYLLPMAAGGGIWELHELLHGRGQDSFGSERLGVWRMTLEMCREHPWLGTGPDTFYYAFAAHLRETGQQLTQRFDNPHNLYLAIAVGSGWPALALFVAVCAASLGRGLRAMRREPFALGWVLAAAAYLAQGIFTFSICLVTPMFYAVLGLCAGMGEPEGLADVAQSGSA